VGLFKGELWVDADTFLPLRESGRFVKNPSVFLKKIEFVRDYEIKDGIAFATLLTKLEETAGDDFDRAALMQGFIVYMSAIQQVCTPEQVQQVSNLIAANPVMKSLLSASASGTAEVIDVEGIEA
jgi:hypothetical protein